MSTGRLTTANGFLFQNTSNKCCGEPSAHAGKPRGATSTVRLRGLLNDTETSKGESDIDQRRRTENEREGVMRRGENR